MGSCAELDMQEWLRKKLREGVNGGERGELAPATIGAQGKDRPSDPGRAFSSPSVRCSLCWGSSN